MFLRAMAPGPNGSSFSCSRLLCLRRSQDDVQRGRMYLVIGNDMLAVEVREASSFLGVGVHRVVVGTEADVGTTVLPTLDEKCSQGRPQRPG